MSDIRSPRPRWAAAWPGGITRVSSLRESVLDRFALVADVIDRVPRLGPRAAYAKQAIREKLIEHKHYSAEHGEDLPESRDWKWQ